MDTVSGEKSHWRSFDVRTIGGTTSETLWDENVECGHVGLVEATASVQDSVSAIFALHSKALAGEVRNSESKTPEQLRPQGLRRKIFSLPPRDGATILQAHLDSLPEAKRHNAFAELVSGNWKWLCKAAPYLQFPEPEPFVEGQTIRLGFRSLGLANGGIGRVTQLLANHFAQDSRYHVTIFLDEAMANCADYLLHPDVSVVVTPTERRNFNVDWKPIMEEHPQDLMLLLDAYMAKNFQNILLLKSLGIRVFAQEHGNVKVNFGFGSFRDRMEHLVPLYSSCDAVSCLSRTDLYEWREQNVTNSCYMPNPPTFDPETVERAKLDNHNILWVGRLSTQQKRPDLAIETFAKVIEKVPDARLTMVGWTSEAACTKHCEHLIQKYGLQDTAKIVGYQSDMVPFYSSSAILLCTSNSSGESFSMSTVEGKSFGLPTVAMALPYLETFQRGCVQTPQNDTDALADAVVDLLQNYDKRKKLGDEALADVKENFSERVTFSKYEKIIDAIIHGKNAVRELCAAEPMLDARTAKELFATQNFFSDSANAR
jgi:glycosyltransferase involved in cell wall biosynthesis